MSWYRRSRTGGASYFFTVNTFRRIEVLTHAEVRVALRQGISKVRETMPFTIVAWVLLPDHLHAIWTLPPGDVAYGKRWGIIKAHVSRQCASLVTSDAARTASRLSRHEHDFWQRRFWEHQIRDEEDLERHVDYIHFNPVKHGWVQAVAQWPHSTFHRFAATGLYPNDWGTDPGAIIGSGGE